MRQCFVVVFAVLAACTTQSREDASVTADSARRAFADTVAAMVIDTTLFELRGHLFVKIENPNKDDESPLADREVPHPSNPGPHTMDGKLYAELETLRALLTWAYYEQGTAASWLRDHIDALLRPHLRAARRRAKRSPAAK